MSKYSLTNCCRTKRTWMDNNEKSTFISGCIGFAVKYSLLGLYIAANGSASAATG